LILTDISLPVTDGLFATREIKKLDGAGEISIICITANGRNCEAEAKEAGCKRLIDKPVDFEIPEEALSRYLKDDRFSDG